MSAPGTPEYEARFMTVIGLLSEAFNRPPTDLRLEAYRRVLGHLPIEALEDAADEILATATFMPAPAEIRMKVEGVDEDKVELAWTELHALVRRRGYLNEPRRWDDPILQRTVTEIYGNWKSLCDALPGPGAGAAYHAAAKQFRAVYGSLAREGDRERRRLSRVPMGGELDAGDEPA